MLNTFMRRFSDWFSSPAGVIQTFAVTTAIGIVEQIWPNIDPQHFFYMYFMTYYSTVTQTILAYASKLSADKSDAILQEVRMVQAQQAEMTETILQLAKNQTDTMRALLVIAERMQSGIEEIADEIEELQEDEAAENARRAATKRR
ncbi:MAG: hypothetical protein K6T83_01265 [Alicyclobacillus sp.]|nr:hypothetical protein [Alicyclobacillus sp.]